MQFPSWVKASWLPKIETAEPPHGLSGLCWLWLGARTPDNYGVVAPAGREVGAVYLHRYSFEQHTGTLLGKDDGGHLCGRQNCFQPEHIERQSRRHNRRSSTAARFDHLSAADVTALACGHWLKTGARHGY